VDHRTVFVVFVLLSGRVPKIARNFSRTRPGRELFEFYIKSRLDVNSSFYIKSRLDVNSSFMRAKCRKISTSTRTRPLVERPLAPGGSRVAAGRLDTARVLAAGRRRGRPPGSRPVERMPGPAIRPLP
jgi:hypothetical protein